MTDGISVSHVYQHMGVSLILWLLVTLAVLVDLWDGVYTAKILGERVHSHKLRDTIRKAGEYWRLLLMGFIADSVGILFPFWAWPYLSILICLGVIAIEGRSVLEHARKRRSHVADVPDIIKSIVDCAEEHSALELLNKIKDTLEKTKS